MLDIGRVCVKTAGREAGKVCVVIKNVDDNFVFVTGPKSLTKVKRRRCNVDHLEPLGFMLKIKDDAPDADVERAMEKEQVLKKVQTVEVSGEAGKEAKPAEKVKPAEKAKPAEEKKEKQEKSEAKPKKDGKAAKPKKAAAKDKKAKK